MLEWLLLIKKENNEQFNKINEQRV
jgi:hypothetical protein